MSKPQLKVLSNPPAAEHVAACGLFCSNCGSFKKGRCQGCQVKPGFSRCPTRACCAEKGITGCWQCADFKAPRDYRECKKVNNPIARVISFFTRSDRPAALALLRDQGFSAYLKARQASGKM